MEGIYAHADFIKVYKAILDATQEIATYLRYHSGTIITTYSFIQLFRTKSDLMHVYSSNTVAIESIRKITI